MASICLGLIKQCCQPQYAAFSHSLEFLAEPLGLKGDFFLESEVSGALLVQPILT
jgi:hypothetical protein